MWFRILFGLKLKKFKKLIILNEDEDFEGNHKYGEIYYIPEDKFLTFMCPCGCKEIENLFIEEIMDRKAGKWAVKIKDNKLKLIGSVGSPYSCRSHYFITYNKIEWLRKMERE